MINIVTLECPNCGGRIERDGDSYFATCPFCGTEICFDEIKGEAQAGQIDALQDRVEEYEEKVRFVDEGRDRIRRWNRWRNISYAACFVLSFLGFFLVGLSGSFRMGNDALLGTGSVIFIGLITVFFCAPPALASYYPDYDIINGRVNIMHRLAMWGKVALTCLGSALLAAFTAYLILKSMGRA